MCCSSSVVRSIWLNWLMLLRVSCMPNLLRCSDCIPCHIFSVNFTYTGLTNVMFLRVNLMFVVEHQHCSSSASFPCERQTETHWHNGHLPVCYLTLNVYWLISIWFCAVDRVFCVICHLCSCPSHSGQLILAVPAWVAAMITGSVFGHG